MILLAKNDLVAHCGLGNLAGQRIDRLLTAGERNPVVDTGKRTGKLVGLGNLVVRIIGEECLIG